LGWGKKCCRKPFQRLENAPATCMEQNQLLEKGYATCRRQNQLLENTPATCRKQNQLLGRPFAGCRAKIQLFGRGFSKTAALMLLKIIQTKHFSYMWFSCYNIVFSKIGCSLFNVIIQYTKHLYAINCHPLHCCA